MSRPDFILIGAMKCGTTTLAAQLGAQDGFFMTDPKEPNYFSDDAIFAKGPDWYAGLFGAAPEGAIRGEASTHYTKLPDHPETVSRMTAALPEVKLVYMIRNPLARLVSHYIHAWSEGLLDGPLDAAQLERHPALIDYGRYGWQCAPYIEAYGRDAILLTSLERLKRDETTELARISRHLGHDGPIRWDSGLAKENVSSERVRNLPMHKLLVDNPVATTVRRNLVPKAVRNLIREGRKIKERPELPESLKTSLTARFRDDMKYLARYFPNDPSLDLVYQFPQAAA